MLLARQKAMVADISLADTYVMCPIRKNNKTTIKILLFNMACSHIPELHLPSLPVLADVNVNIDISCAARLNGTYIAIE